MITLPLWLWLAFGVALIGVMAWLILDYLRLERELEEKRKLFWARYWEQDRQRWQAITADILASLPARAEESEEEDPADVLWAEGEKPRV